MSLKSGITYTFGECAENHVGMQKLGTKHDRGFSLEDMELFVSNFPGKTIERHSLHAYENTEELMLPKAYLYIVKNGFEKSEELFELSKNLDWDRKALMKGKVVNKHARYNLCFDSYNQEPDYVNGKGRVIDVSTIPLLDELHKKINNCIGMTTKIEGNYYYDLSKCGIGYHGDAERSKTIGVRLGGDFPISYRWYYNSKPISENMEFNLCSGDIYIMSEKATGTDWKRKIIPTLRHAAGCAGYVK